MLSAGTRLGVYEIQTVLGAGGMGEVYRARDTKLGRDIAIKVLPESVVADPERAARWQVSTGGGRMPLWSRNGQELIYLSPDGALMGVRVEPAPSWRSSTPARILQGQYFFLAPGRTFDIAADGRRFLMIKQGGATEAAPQNLVVVQNWFEELKRLVPAN